MVTAWKDKQFGQVAKLVDGFEEITHLWGCSVMEYAGSNPALTANTIKRRYIPLGTPTVGWRQRTRDSRFYGGYIINPTCSDILLGPLAQRLEQLTHNQ